MSKKTKETVEMFNTKGNSRNITIAITDANTDSVRRENITLSTILGQLEKLEYK